MLPAAIIVLGAATAAAREAEGPGLGTAATPNQIAARALTVFDYIRRAMPFTAPQSLTADETYALTAYLLYLNEIVGIDERIDATSLPRVRLPNADNFYRANAARD